MNKKELIEIVEALTQQVDKFDLDELEVETEDFRVRLSKRPPMPPMPPMPVMNMNTPAAPALIKTDNEEKESAPAASGKVIKSPIIGTFYAAAAPGKSPFVSVGSKVAKGSVVCIVESMKLMNEINSEFDGTVAEVYVSDGQAVEYDQPLFRLE